MYFVQFNIQRCLLKLKEEEILLISGHSAKVFIITVKLMLYLID